MEEEFLAEVKVIIELNKKVIIELNKYLDGLKRFGAMQMPKISETPILARIFFKQSFLKALNIALLVALLASTYSIIEFLRWEISYTASLGGGGGRTVVFGLDYPGASEVKVAGFFAQVNGVRVPVISANVSKLVEVYNGRLVEGVLDDKGVYVGSLLSEKLSLNAGDELTLTYGGEIVLEIAGIIRFNGPLDYAVIISEKIVDSRDFSWIDLGEKPGHSLTEAEKYAMFQTRDIYRFVNEVDSQLLKMLDTWALIVLLLVASASYTLSAKQIKELSFELSLLRALGLNKRRLTLTILAYASAVSALSSLLGIAIGVATSQIVASILKWLEIGALLTPFLTLSQALKIFAYTTTSSLLGSLIPALKLEVRPVEQTWISL